MSKRLYVGNLAYAATSESLRELFSQAGEVANASVVSDRVSGQSKGFGFVEMTSAEDASSAIQSFNGAGFMGRTLKVDEARPRPQFGNGNGNGYGGGHSFRSRGDSDRYRRR
ncbi:MAG: RNA recognition motif domain-containing protein [Candidatus Binataceae bacterium]